MLWKSDGPVRNGTLRVDEEEDAGPEEEAEGRWRAGGHYHRAIVDLRV